MILSSSIYADQTDTKRLSMEEFIDLACKNDRTFQEILLDELILKYKKDLDLPAGDIILSVKGQYNLALGNNAEDGPQGTVSLSKLFPKTGTALEAQYGITRFNALDVTSSEFNLSISQPVARNAFGRATRIQDKISDIEIDIARHQIAEAYEDYLSYLIKIYYNWYSAYANLKAGETFYSENLKLLKNIQAKRKSKIARPIDVNKIQLQVIAKQENLLSLSNNYNHYTYLIRQAARYSKTEPLMPEEPSLYKETDPSFMNSYTRFTNTSRTYKVLRLLENKGIKEIDKYADDLLPSANLILGYNIEGEDLNLSQDRSKIFAGIEFEMPFPGQKERAAHKTSKVNLKKTRLSITNKHLQLYTDLKDLHEEISKQKKLIELAEEKITLAKAIIQEEAKNYNYGQATLNDLISAENVLEENRFNRINHMIQYYILMVEWMRLTDDLIVSKDIPQH